MVQTNQKRFERYPRLIHGHCHMKGFFPFHWLRSVLYVLFNFTDFVSVFHIKDEEFTSLPLGINKNLKMAFLKKT